MSSGLWGSCLSLLLASTVIAQVPTVHEHPCQAVKPNTRCGYIEVPENLNNPARRKLNIEFIQVRSTANGRDPAAVIDIAGGPGVAETPSGLGLIFEVFGYVLKYRDVVVYDQRGASRSSPLNCDLYGHVPPMEAGDFLPSQGVQRCHQQMSERADLAQYNTTASVEDLDQLRAALGYDKLVLHALSYGTRLAQAYLQAHPEHVRAVVLEGALKPGTRIPLDYAKGMQRTLDAVLGDCRNDPTCKPVASEIDLPKISAMKQIVFTSGGNTLSITPPQFFEIFRILLYDGEGARQVPLLLAEVSHGDAHQLGKLYERAHGDDPNFSWPLWLSTTCAEDTSFIGEDQLHPATQGTLAGDYRIRQQQQACKVWPVPKRDPGIGKPSNVPLLLMEGQVDPVTPPWSDAELRRYFPEGRQVILPHVHHMPVGLDGIECLDEIEEQFLATLDNKKLNVSCLNTIHRKPFIVNAKESGN
jgi:pimeloyl-ACP methyl ester carboxylesterase